MIPARRSTTAGLSTAVVLATAGGLLTAVTAPASAATSCASPVFKRQFYANTSFSGTPKKTDCDGTIDQNWGTGAPATGLPRNDFGVRWTVTRDFGSGGPFAFGAAAQDGVRVYLDGVRKVNLWKNVSTTARTQVNLTIPPGKHTLRVDFVNWTGTANVRFSYAPRTSASVDTVRPLAPTGTAATYDPATGKARLTWAKNKEMDLAGYRVYRRVKGDDFAVPVATTTSTSYTDTGLPYSGEVFSYEVRAYDRAGNVSRGSADQDVTSVDRIPPDVPRPPEVTDATELGGLRLGWKQVDEAASYRVYRSSSKDGTYTRIASTSLLSYRDTSAATETTYYYRLSAVDAAGNESDKSPWVIARRHNDSPPSAVTGLTVTPTGYGFELNWEANPTPDLHRYVVYGGEVVTIGGKRYCDAWELEWLSADTTSYAHVVSRPDGEERCFYVDAVDTSWNSSYDWTRSAQIVAATELDTVPKVGSPVTSPLSLIVWPAAGDEGNRLAWDGTEVDATGGYRLYRYDPATERYERIAEVGPGSYLYFDTGVPRGTTSYYWVTAVDADGNESAPAGDWAVTGP
ncbi:fibronectin type III domain-containing protein [Streptomyces flavalbus]|uniref:Fibronectin type III domain-containing protein n=1 Tax=Streptomyces flavalbus TaxID=2665155 RepID=A0ABW2WB20_9ACTN